MKTMCIDFTKRSSLAYFFLNEIYLGRLYCSNKFLSYMITLRRLEILCRLKPVDFFRDYFIKYLVIFHSCIFLKTVHDFY